MVVSLFFLFSLFLGRGFVWWSCISFCSLVSSTFSFLSVLISLFKIYFLSLFFCFFFCLVILCSFLMLSPFLFFCFFFLVSLLLFLPYMFFSLCFSVVVSSVLLHLLFLSFTNQRVVWIIYLHRPAVYLKENFFC